ncbi:hypothetical protein [Acinetobacter junii]|nr:hypothetical protein [Acinetobacter junii]MDI6622744.1 hypothetical protein [Acinetobacter junii]
MDPQLFKDLIASIKVAGVIRRKKVKASRINRKRPLNTPSEFIL